METSRGPATMGLMILGGLILAVATMVIGGAAYRLTRSSVRAYANTIRYNLVLMSAEAGPFYVEI